VLIPAAELRIRRIQTRLKWVTAKEHRNRYGQVSGREKTAGMAVGQRRNVTREVEDRTVAIRADRGREKTYWRSPHHAAAALTLIARNLRLP
jgi:hypothetical protein